MTEPRERCKKAPIEQINLREKLAQVRLSFDAKLAEILAGRPDVSHAEIQKEFGISHKIISRVSKRFNVSARKRGPKPKNRQPLAIAPDAIRPTPEI